MLRPAPTVAGPAPVRIPSPEQLGLLSPSSPRETTLDWAGMHRRLQALGATGIHLAPLAEGGWRVTFALATSDPAKLHRIQAQAAAPEAALQMALARADAWLADTRRVETPAQRR